ncbi:hypothetical protein GGR57DRAFT_197456 [Xylariaceae sp. FL1272]|nr:hypothetical protein GGR57DRAFT_197456 [Xylariaceae sp. FL1272]
MAAASFKVKAVYDYASSHEDDLPFNVGQIITVNDDEDPEWYGGEYVDDDGVKHEGIFPRNFVEKYEPTAPPRPTRRKKEAEPVAAPPPPPADDTSTESSLTNAAEDTPLEQAIKDVSVPELRPPMPVGETGTIEAPSIPVANPPETASVPAPAPIEPQEPDTVSPLTAAPQPKPAPARAGPPPVSQKPSSNAFKDRIAAFNKPAAPPVAPFKPGGLSSGSGSGSSFIRKPFVAPPPSRNAYVPPPRDVPTPKVYRREEDPEIKEVEAESQENAEKAGLVAGASAEPQGEDQPKPTTLKERIALLQKQQAEAAQRHMDAAVKKDKPKRPPKKRMDSEGVQDSQETATTQEAAAAATPPPLERKSTTETSGRPSMDEPRSSRPSLTIRRKSTGLAENDGNEADMSGAGDTTEGQEDLTERDDTDEKPTPLARPALDSPVAEQEPGGENGQEEDDDVDPEVRRKEELRARMAKMSGGMGMAGMFGPPGMMPLGGGARKPKPPAPVERRPSELSEGPSSPRMAPPPMIMALPGMGKPKPVEEEAPDHDVAEDSPGEEITPVPTTSHAPETPSFTSAPPPPVPGGKPAPPLIPADSRPPPPPPPAGVASPSVGSESDDEMSENPPLETTKGESPSRSRAPPPIPVTSPPMPISPRMSTNKRASTIGDEMSPASPGLSPLQSKRNSRPPPPIPGAAPPIPGQARPPPPPPPGAGLSRTSTSDERVTPMQPGRLDNGEEGEFTEYEGDYDTDIGSSVHHKDALKAHVRDSSIDTSNAPQSPSAERRPTMPPPIPSGSIPRAAPPPIPSQPAPGSRVSLDAPRAAPPPPPPPQPKQSAYSYDDDDDYDPYNYNAMKTPRNHSVPVSRSSTMHEEVNVGTRSEVGPYGSPPPPPPPADRPMPPPPQSVPRAPPRKSLDVLRTSIGRRSVDAGRPSIDTSFMANDVDLGIPMQWWLASNGIPPVFQGRRDIYTESTESTAMEDGRSIVTKQLFILFQDYSQTIITSRFDPGDPSQTEVDQSHEPPPRPLRQDELEDAYESFGRKLASSVASKKDSVVGDGKPHALIHELLRPMKGALLPIGTRAYGALVYSNMANASTQLNDAIRPGDIISIRNAKFQGKHGAMHQKYSIEVGKPDHVAIVAEWDGTKKKVRAWEQGRESKKVKQESFKLDDLRSGEVKIWRVMPRTWVGWRSSD